MSRGAQADCFQTVPGRLLFYARAWAK